MSILIQRQCYHKYSLAVSHNQFIIGVWGIGLATPTVSLDTVPLGTDTNSWVLTSDAMTVHNSQTISRGKQKPSEGDIIVSYSVV